MRLDGHPDLALRLLVAVAMRYWWGKPDQETRAAVVAAAERLPIAQDEPGLLAVLAHTDPVGRGARVIDQISRMTPNAADPAAMYLIGSAANAVWAYDLSLAFLEIAVDGLREQGRLGLLAQALVAQAWAAVHQAREPLAVSAAEEAARLARETSEPQWVAAAQLAQATIAAERGDLDTAESRAREAEGLLISVGATPMLALVQFVRGRAAMAHQRYEEALEHHRRTLDPADPAYHPFVGAWGLADLVEAAAHSGRKETARAYLDQLESLPGIGEVLGQRILDYPATPVPFSSLYEPTAIDVVQTFNSLLFLAKQQRVTVSQEEFPYGEIWVTPKLAEASAVIAEEVKA